MASGGPDHPLSRKAKGHRGNDGLMILALTQSLRGASNAQKGPYRLNFDPLIRPASVADEKSSAVHRVDYGTRATDARTAQGGQEN
jgi:hypothetical protein